MMFQQIIARQKIEVLGGRVNTSYPINNVLPNGVTPSHVLPITTNTVVDGKIYSSSPLYDCGIHLLLKAM